MPVDDRERPTSVRDPHKLRLTYHFARFVANWSFILFGSMRIYGAKNVPRTGGLILAVNHQSNFDPVLTGAPIPRELHHMARHSLFYQKQFGWLIRYLNAYEVRRGTADRAAIKETFRRLKAGHPVIIYPEGTRTPDGRVHQAKPGVMMIAKRSACPTVIVSIEGAYDAWPKSQKLPKPHHLWISYGRPISASVWDGLDAADAARDLTRRMREQHNALRRRVGRTEFDYNDDE